MVLQAPRQALLPSKGVGVGGEEAQGLHQAGIHAAQAHNVAHAAGADHGIQAEELCKWGGRRVELLGAGREAGASGSEQRKAAHQHYHQQQPPAATAAAGQGPAAAHASAAQ